MTQNTSSAVMQQRQKARDALDDFPTPPWATRALCEWLMDEHYPLSPDTVREPCANRGYMVRPLREYFSSVMASDVHDYKCGFTVEDYLFGPDPAVVDFTIMNPPFRLAEQFIQRALRTSRIGVCVLVRTAFLESVSRYESLFSKTPPSTILQFTERVPMLKGRVDKKATTATAYCWLYWDAMQMRYKPDHDRTRFHWIPPCRKLLEKPGDYDDAGMFL